jgi:hypothetical protein
MKRDANDITREEGPDALREAFDRSVEQQQHAKNSNGHDPDPTAMLADATRRDRERRERVDVAKESNSHQAPSSPAKKITAIYPYVDRDGRMIYQLCRLYWVIQWDPCESFAQRRPLPGEDGKWIWGLEAGEYVRGPNGDFYAVTEECKASKGERRTFPKMQHGLYRFDELLAEITKPPEQRRTPHLTETEKDAETLRAMCLLATTNSGGATAWEPHHIGLLAGFGRCVIHVGSDKIGRNRRNLVAVMLEPLMRVRVLDWAEHWPDCPPLADVTACIEHAGGTLEKLNAIVEGLLDWKPPPEPEPQNRTAAIPYRWPDPSIIPPRQFLYGRHYIRSYVSVTIGAGGRIKTTHELTEAISMTAGRNLLTGETFTPLRVWHVNGEETQDELDRRVAAICQRYGVKQTDCGDRLLVQSVRKKLWRLATLVYNTPTLDHELLDEEHEMREKKIDVLQLDPFISFHSVNENLNEHMDLLIKEGLGGITERTNSAIDIAHHSKKLQAGQEEATVEDGRGASGIIYAVRSARVFNFMTAQEASKLGISEDDRRLHVRVSNGKANMGPLGKAEWLKIVVEKLANGDEIACSSSWKPTDPFSGVCSSHMRRCCELAQTGAYGIDSRSPDWIGYPVAKMLDINIAHGAENDPQDVTRIKQVLATWIKNKVLATETREDSKRRKRVYVIPGPRQPDAEKRPRYSVMSHFENWSTTGANWSSRQCLKVRFCSSAPVAPVK